MECFLFAEWLDTRMHFKSSAEQMLATQCCNMTKLNFCIVIVACYDRQLQTFCTRVVTPSCSAPFEMDASVRNAVKLHDWSKVFIMSCCSRPSCFQTGALLFWSLGCRRRLLMHGAAEGIGEVNQGNNHWGVDAVLFHAVAWHNDRDQEKNSNG